MSREKQGLWLIGIGASAGGLEALQSFVTNLPPEIPAAFIVAQHLAPKAKSLLVELLARHSKLPVLVAETGQQLEAGRIYVVPPNHDVSLKNGSLLLTVAEAKTRPKPSVDSLFESLAEVWGDKAVGIVLSGTGTDGSEGIRLIHSHGGLTLAQDDLSARYDGMPRSAVGTGSVEIVMPPDQMAKALLDLLQAHSMRTTTIQENGVLDIRRILSLIRTNLGTDFTQYKPSTLRRRLEKHMRSLQIGDFERYLKHLEGHPSDLQALSQEMLISVTSFFRDPDAFEALEAQLKPIFASRSGDREFRTWVAGCATGEEAYSVAMTLAELNRKLGRALPFKVFATDLDQDAVMEARAGLYSEDSVRHLSPELVERYFIRRQHGYEVSKYIRDLLVFARQDLVQSAPFVKVDLITCRNVMIYFEPFLQRKIFETFHYALNANGILFLGKSEAGGEAAHLFEPLDRTARIFRKLFVVRANLPAAPSSFVPMGALPRRTPAAAPSFADLAQKELMAKFSAAAVVVDEAFTALHVLGDINPFVRYPEGDASLNLMMALPKEIGVELPALVRKAAKEGSPQRSRTYNPARKSKGQGFRIEVRPLSDATQGKCFLIVFETVKSRKTTPSGSVVQNESENVGRVLQLEEDLAMTREHLQTVIEELGVSNEELQSVNEELGSTNEELQAANEQLETTNEELQSTNEELTTLNEELVNKSTELRSSNTNLENIQNSIGSPLIVIDNNLRVLRYNTLATKLFDLSPADIGNNIARVSCHCEITNFEEVLRSTLDNGKPAEIIVDGYQVVYQLRVLPSFDENRKATGAILVFFDNTVLIRTEERLRLSEERIRAIIRFAPNPIWLKDTLGRYMVVNNAFADRFGVTPEDVIGKTDREIFKPGLAATLRDPDLEILHRRESLRREIRVPTPNGGEAVLIASGFPLSDAKSKTPYAVGTVAVDVTEGLRAQEELRRSEVRYRAMVEDQAIFVCRLAPDLKFTFVNGTLARAFGGEVAEYIGEPFTRLCGQNNRARVETEFQRLNPQVSVTEFEAPLTRIDGQQRWTRWIVRAIADVDGRIIEYQVAGFDVTSHRTEADRLQERETLFRRIFDHATDQLAVFKVADGEFVLESFNRSAEQAMGYSFAQLLGRNLRGLYEPEIADSVVTKFRECVSSKEPQLLETQVVVPGGILYLSTTLVPIANAQGEVERVASLSRDVSGSKRIENELRQEKDRAERASRSKTDFVASMSHELRTPLNIVLGMSQLLAESELEAEQMQFVDGIQRSGQILLSLIEDILDLSKVEEGKLKLERIPFSIKDIVAGVMESFGRDASAKKLLFKYHIAEGADSWVLGDPGRLRQVLTNLVGNAVKFTDSGSVTVEVRRHPERTGGTSDFLFRVVDTGIGIREKDHDRIFKKFSQVDSGLSRRYGGSGLGLAICERLVQMMGGRIGFESSWSHGSTFWFHLPLPTAPVAESRSLFPQPAEGLSRPIASSQSLKILAVDDNPDSRMVIRLFLQNLGHDSHVVASGPEAIERIGQQDFDLVLMDIQMPGMNGYEATARIRQNDSTIRLPIIALTANAMSGDVEKCLEAGMNDYLSKPVNIDSLRALLQKWSPPSAAKN